MFTSSCIIPSAAEQSELGVTPLSALPDCSQSFRNQSPCIRTPVAPQSSAGHPFSLHLHVQVVKGLSEVRRTEWVPTAAHSHICLFAAVWETFTDVVGCLIKR